MSDIDDVIYPHVGETQCNATAIRQAARYMTRFYDSAMTGIGLRGTQYTTLLYSLTEPKSRTRRHGMRSSGRRGGPRKQ